LCVDRRADSVVVWSPPRVTIRGTVKSLELVFLAEITLCALSSCFNATVLSLKRVSCGTLVVQGTYEERQRSVTTIYDLRPVDEDVLACKLSIAVR
jgi:hypothetical protein